MPLATVYIALHFCPRFGCSIYNNNAEYVLQDFNPMSCVPGMGVSGSGGGGAQDDDYD